MASPVLHFGDQTPAIEELQKLLNKRVTKVERSVFPNDMPITGRFHNHTLDFVKRFQSRGRLQSDGIVGPLTWAALRDTELFNKFDEPATPIKAADDFTCWAAGTAMLRKEGTPNTFRVPGVLFETQQPSGKVGGLENSDANIRKFANYYNFGNHIGPVDCMKLCNLMNLHGRIMINVRGITSNLTAGSPNDSHWMILAGLRGDMTPGGTTLTLYDTSPNGGSPLIVASYSYLKSIWPQFIFQCVYGWSNQAKKLY